MGLTFDVSGCAPSGTPPESGSIRVLEGTTVVFTYTLGAPPSLPGNTETPCTGGSIHSNGNFPIRPAQYVLTAATPGTHIYTAVYSGDAFYAPSTSTPVTVNVTALPTVSPGQSFGGPTATLTGDATLRMSGGGALCGFTRAAFLPVDGTAYSPPPNFAPPGVTFPHGLVGFVTSGCTPGATLTFTLSLPAASAPTTAYWKYGPTPDNTAPHWYQLPVSIQGSVVWFSIIDGGLGDDDLTANGTVVDIGGPTVDSAQTIPTMSEWMLLLLTLLIASTAAYETAHRLSRP
jgi:hypothetical protein